MIVSVDSNIVFSAILNTNSLIGNLLLSSHKTFEFYSCHFLIFEIEKHWNKLIEVSKLDEKDLIEAKRLIYKQINFIDEKIIPLKHRKKAYDLVKEIDLNDAVFIALNEFQESLFWTGDKMLYSGLKSKGYEKIITTTELVKLRDNLEKRYRT